ncbi:MULTISPECIES: hypothetical protein [unclassified Vibrio]|uniref:YkvI family membrane protein n=1 Tax=unclassified Vibrio TaxID=2614977 RepID=UPI003551397C
MSNSVFKRIILPGLVLQSVLIGGGYATGRELIEFFFSSGPLGGLLGMLVATAAISLISMFSFELSRMSQSYTYRSFIKQLLGKFWFLYELCYFGLGILVLAVVGSAAGQIVTTHLSIDANIGTIALMALVCALVAWGSKLMEAVLSGWSFLLYGTYAVFVYLYLGEYGENLDVKVLQGAIEDTWFMNAIKYVGYNIATLPLILFVVAHMTSRKDALTAGAFAGPLAMAPALLFYFAMVATPGDILNAAVPSDFMMSQLDAPWLQTIFYVVLFGTFVETCAAFIHALNERVAEVYTEKKNAEIPKVLRIAIAAVILMGTIYLSGRVGLIGLIAGGYGTLTWGFVVLFILPILGWGIYNIFYKGIKSAASDESTNSAVPS